MTENLPHDQFGKNLRITPSMENSADKAIVYLKETGAKAVSLSSFRNAVLYFEQALEALRHLRKTSDNLRNAVDVRIDIRNALFILGDFRQGINI